MIFFLIILLLMLPKDRFSYYVNKNFWLLKSVFPLILFVIFLFIGGNIFVNWAKAARYISILYLLFQDFTYNEFFFKWSNIWKRKSQGNACYVFMFTFLSVISSGATLVLIVMNYTYNFECGWAIFFCVYNTVYVAVYYGLTFLKLRNDVNILTTSMYSLYSTYYFYSAFGSDTEPGCSKMERSSNWVLGEILINVFLISCVFLFMTFSREIPLFINMRPVKAEDF